ncbi:MAG: methyltransferase domain-containing protein [Fibrobacteria bacterium]
MHDQKPEGRSADQAIKDQVQRYYEATTEDYLKYYQTDWHHHMHYGFDRDLPRGGNPTENMVCYLARLAGLKPGDRLLDAGCGVGGSSIFLAREMGCHCIGITLVEKQARLATAFAAVSAASAASATSMKKGAGLGSARFAANDFHVPSFRPGTFDVVWALESFDHAVDKRAWVASMSALLKPGGRLLVADGFRAQAPGSRAEAQGYASFLAGWAVPHLCSAEEMEAYGAAAGLQSSHSEDISADVIPHARAIFRFGLIFIPLRWILAKVGLTSPEKLGNAYATYFQYRTLKRGLWAYRVHCFRKPG